MNPEALPPALSDLFLPEAVTPGDKASGDRAGQGSSTRSSADADRFEQYLTSARRSVTTDQALPAPAAADDRLTDRSDARRLHVEQASRPERPRADRDDRRSIEARDADPVDRQEPAAGEDRVDGLDDDRHLDDDRPLDDDMDRDRSDAESTSGAAAEADRSAETDTGAETADIDGHAEIGVSIDASEVALATTGFESDVDVDGDAVTDGNGEAGGAVDPAVATVDGDLADVSDQIAEQIETPLVNAQQDRAVDPTAAVAVAAVTTPETDGSDGQATDELTIDLDDGAGTDAELVAQQTGQTDTDAQDAEAEVDSSDGDTATDVDATDQGQQNDPTSADDSLDSANPGAETSATDGPVVAPLTSPAAFSNPTATGSTGGPTAGIDAVAGPAALRNRTTTNGTTSAKAGQEAQAPLTDGESGDPLWLQVRRAMGSFRTLRNGEQQMTIRLRPAELGSVMVRVNTGENGTTVSLIADSAVAANQLTQQRQQLISELEQGGLADVAVDVGTNAETDLRDGAADDDRDLSNEADADGTAAAASVAGAGSALPRTGGRGRRSGGSSGSLVDVDL